ncbi:MAG: type II toxin-antitoxin system HicB family antitoxin [Myxococcaceae bacterium]
MVIKKDIRYYLNLNWTYTVEPHKNGVSTYYVVRVNELPGVCTDAESIQEAMDSIKEAIEAAVCLYLKNEEPVPEPIKEEDYRGNIAYRTTKERHYQVAKIAKGTHRSISKTIDYLIDCAVSVQNRVSAA